MSATSSAVPSNLQEFVTKAGAATDSLGQAISAAAGAVTAFLDAPCDGRFRPGGLGNAWSQVHTLHDDDHHDEQWLKVVHDKFVRADTGTLPDATLAAALKAAHISDTVPKALTADEPVYQGTTMYSGWRDDPVSTGAGHFLEIEDDIPMPATLGPLRWLRVYSSRFVSDTGAGRGWHTWAGCRLEPTASEVTYHGPDGQSAAFTRVGADYLRHPAMEAELAEVDDGFELRWRWTSRFPGMVWRFDGEGHLRTLADPFAGTVSALHREGRLVGLRHEGGRSLSIEWIGGHIGAVVASDGRRCAYRYVDDDLVEVERPAGAQRYAVDAAGRVREVHDADGVRVVANEYDTDGRVVRQLAPGGRTSTYRWLAPSTLVVEDEEERTATLYRHDEAGRLVELRLPDGTGARRRFDEVGNPVEVVDLRGGVTRRTYDVYGNCVRQVDPEGGVAEWEWDAEGRLLRYVDPSGVWEEYQYADGGAVPSRVTGPAGYWREHTLAGGRITGVKDIDGVEERYQLDADGQVVAVTDGEGVVRSYTYGPDGTCTSVTAPHGEEWATQTDGAGRVLAARVAGGRPGEVTRTPAGRVLTSTDFTGAVTTRRYGPDGLLEAVTDPSGAELGIEWDSAGRPVGLVLGAGGRFSYGRDSLGRVTDVTDATGALWRQAWDGELPTAVTDPTGQGPAVDLDHLGRPRSATTAAGITVELEWDPAGRFLAGRDPRSGSSCTMIHDEAGRPVEWRIDGEVLSRATYTPGGRLQSVATPDGRLWQWSYDRAGRVVEERLGDAVRRTTYDPSGRVERVVNPDGTRFTQRWGEDGYPAAVESDGRAAEEERWDPLGRLVEWGSEGASHHLRYDHRGLVVEATDPNGGRTQLEYDANGYVSAVEGEGSRWGLERDPNGRTIGVTDPLGRRTSWSLDGAGRRVEYRLPDQTTLAYRWDGEGHLLGVAAGGDPLIEVRPGDGAEPTLVRDAAGQLLELHLDGQGRTVAFVRDGRAMQIHRDDLERTIETRSPDGNAVTVHLDEARQADRIDYSGLPSVELRRDGEGRILEVRAEGLQREWERRPGGAVSAYRETIGERTTTVELDYDRDGRVVAVSGPDGTVRYAYDPAGQLVSESGPEGEWRWDYDLRGRVVAEAAPGGTRRFEYDSADQLTAVTGPDGTTAVTYDACGRRVKEAGAAGTVEYRWDALGRLIRVDGPEGGFSIDYDPLGLPVRVSGQDVEWIEGPFGPIVTRVGERRLAGLPGLPLAEGDSTGMRWVSSDWRGDVAGTSTWGERAGTGPALGFLGELHLGRYVWLRNRVYDPQTHTFLTPDPEVSPLGWPGSPANTYLYARNDPLQWLDPTGRKPVTAAEAMSQMHGWTAGHASEALTVLAAAGAIVLVATNPELIPLVLLGAAAGGGSSIVGQLIGTGKIDWQEVALNTAVGGFLGAFVPGLPMPAAMSARVAAGAGYGAGSGVFAQTLDDVGTHGTLDWKNDLIAGTVGAVTGGIFHGGARWTDSLKPNQVARLNRFLADHPSADVSDPKTLSRQWSNRMRRFQPIADAANRHDAILSNLIAPPTTAAATGGLSRLAGAGDPTGANAGVATIDGPSPATLALPGGAPPPGHPTVCTARPPGFIGPVAAP
ncbi:DUF6531 domain-containing protein [Acidiferrimicrobium sp. IK]|uniref:DUF6531 domain-containing protein n=1 Tax=Acidiferrimicrobium sp. IK TaxID=2871700 RepID=UPI0021CB78A6|nr:DUF6531 domain-containing protein [Acidiferrimicrobium sp. IK]MCU4184689.1 DUF6531 domain-containing protein [Acidiferrimicrobium sp. IK]